MPHADELDLRIEAFRLTAKVATIEREAASLREACETAEHFLAAVDKETQGKWEPAHAVLQVLRAALEVKP